MFFRRITDSFIVKESISFPFVFNFVFFTEFFPFFVLVMDVTHDDSWLYSSTNTRVMKTKNNITKQVAPTIVSSLSFFG